MNFDFCKFVFYIKVVPFINSSRKIYLVFVCLSANKSPTVNTIADFAQIADNEMRGHFISLQ